MHCESYLHQMKYNAVFLNLNMDYLNASMHFDAMMENEWNFATTA